MLTLLAQIHNLFRVLNMPLWAMLFSAQLLLQFSVASAEVKIDTAGELEGRLVFTEISPAGQKDILVANFETGEVRELFASKALEEYPSWSPDGKKVVFYSDVCGDREIFSIRSDGKKLKRLTDSKGVDEDPDWSPDGKNIVFKSSRGSNDSSNIFVMAADGSTVRRLTNLPKENAVPKWSPRGDEIIFATNKDWPGWDLLVHHLPSKSNFQLTTGSKNYSRASWHPSGEAISFSFGETSNVGIYSVRKGSNDAEKLTDGPGRHFDPVYSDDGKTVIFTKELDPGKKNYHVFAKTGKVGKPKQLTSGNSTVRNISWTSLPDYPFPPEDILSGEVKSEPVANSTPDQNSDFSEMVDLACGRITKLAKPKVESPVPTTASKNTGDIISQENSEPSIIRSLEDIKQEE